MDIYSGWWLLLGPLLIVNNAAGETAVVARSKAAA
jgi:hypothetical protein